MSVDRTARSTLARAGAPSIEDVVSARQARAMCGGITRASFGAWRELEGFPLSWHVDDMEFWDREELAAWIGVNVDPDAGRLLPHMTKRVR